MAAAEGVKRKEWFKPGNPEYERSWVLAAARALVDANGCGLRKLNFTLQMRIVCIYVALQMKFRPVLRCTQENGVC